MTLTSDIYSIISLILSLLKSISIFPGFTLFNAIALLVWVSIIAWILGALTGVINFRSGGGADSDDD